MTWWSNVWHYFVIKSHAVSIGANLGSGHFSLPGRDWTSFVVSPWYIWFPSHWRSNLCGSSFIFRQWQLILARSPRKLCDSQKKPTTHPSLLPLPPQPIWKIVSVHLVKEMSAGDMKRERKSPSLSISQSAPVKKISLKWSIMTRSRISIPHHTLLPLILITGVHPPYPHPNSPMWQRTVVGCEPRWRETNLLVFDLLKRSLRRLGSHYPYSLNKFTTLIISR